MKDKNKEKIKVEWVDGPLPYEKIKTNIAYKRKQMNGLALMEKIKETTELNKNLIQTLDKKEDKAVIIDLVKTQSEIITNYQKDSINRDKWNKFFLIFRNFILTSGILFIALFVIAILHASKIFILDDMIVKLLTGVIGSLTSLLVIGFLGVFSYLGLKKEK